MPITNQRKKPPQKVTSAPTGSNLPPRYQKAITAGKMTPDQAAKRFAAFKGGALPGQRKPAGGGGGGVGRPPAPPALGPPIFGGPPMPGGGVPGMPPGAGLPGSMPSPGAFNDPFAMFMAAVPGMRLNAQKQIGDAVASAGFGGNRWGTSTANDVARIGSENAMMENALLQKTLYDYANQTENRALQATGMGMGLGGMLDQQAQDRVRLPFEVGTWEQGRQDQLAQFPYMDFEKNKLGWLPMLLQAAMSQGAGSPGAIYTTQDEPAKPGAIDWLTLLGGLFG